MKFEHLIWFVIFLVYVLSFIFKRMRAASKTGDKGILRPQWKRKLDEFLSKARQEMGAAPKDGSAQETVWDRLVSQEYDDAEPLQDKMPTEETESTRETKPAPMTRPTPVKAVERSTAPIGYGKTISSKDKESAYAIADLRKAVIWAEILAPPLALRD